MNKIKQLLLELKQLDKNDPNRALKIKEVIEAYAQFLLPEARQMVQIIEAKPETTKARYGEYMRILSGLHGFNLFAMTRALVLAGASQEGLQGASIAMGQSL